MELGLIHQKVLALTKCGVTAKGSRGVGLWYQGCGPTGEMARALFEAINVRLAGQNQKVEIEGCVLLADSRLTHECRRWFNSIQLEEVQAILHDALSQVMGQLPRKNIQVKSHTSGFER